MEEQQVRIQLVVDRSVYPELYDAIVVASNGRQRAEFMRGLMKEGLEHRTGKGHAHQSSKPAGATAKTENWQQPSDVHDTPKQKPVVADVAKPTEIKPVEIAPEITEEKPVVKEEIAGAGGSDGTDFATQFAASLSGVPNRR